MVDIRLSFKYYITSQVINGKKKQICHECRQHGHFRIFRRKKIFFMFLGFIIALVVYVKLVFLIHKICDLYM